MSVETVLSVGSSAPGFSVPDSTGRTRTLAEMTASRALAVVFVGAASDPRSVRQLRDFGSHLRDFNAELVNLAAAAVLTPQAGEKLRDTLDIRFPLLCDAEGELCRAWGLLDGGPELAARPALVVVDLEGRVTQLTVGRGAERPGWRPCVDALRSGAGSAQLVRVRPKLSDRIAAWRLARV